MIQYKLANESALFRTFQKYKFQSQYFMNCVSWPLQTGEVMLSQSFLA